MAMNQCHLRIVIAAHRLTVPSALSVSFLRQLAPRNAVTCTHLTDSNRMRRTIEQM